MKIGPSSIERADIFVLPDLYTGIGQPVELSRLTIAGLVNVIANGVDWPMPLLLLDGRPAAQTEKILGGIRHHFFTPGKRPGQLWELTQHYIGKVDVPHDSPNSPSSYTGRGSSEVLLLNPPISYLQRDFNSAAAGWLSELSPMEDVQDGS